MMDSGNLGEIIHSSLPADLVEFLRLAGQTAPQMGYKMYLVGGVVRDLLLGVVTPILTSWWKATPSILRGNYR